MQYPYWMMAAGAIFVVVGFVGLAFRKNDAALARRPRDYSGNEIDAAGLVLTLLGKPRLPQC